MGRPPTCICGRCQKCKHAAYMREWWRQQTPEHRRRLVEGRDPEKVRERERRRYQRDKVKRFKFSRQWAARNPEKRRAQDKVAKALLAGKMLREPCEVCGAERAHAHHPDYSKPLEVRWLCALHHMAEHKRLREQAA